MHVVQANLLRVPEGCAHRDVLELWRSLVDIAEIAAAGGTRVTVLQASDRAERMLLDALPAAERARFIKSLATIAEAAVKLEQNGDARLRRKVRRKPR